MKKYTLEECRDGLKRIEAELSDPWIAYSCLNAGYREELAKQHDELWARIHELREQEVAE